VVNVSSENLLPAVFNALAYADVFDYPLTAPEVYRYLPSQGSTIDEVIQTLSDESLFSQIETYFTLRGREEIIETRKRRADVAARLWPKAARYGRLIALLPFVRMVAVTGSLSMNNADQGNDVDYIIVTAPNRLWTCRAFSLLVARFAKLEGIRLCPNYLVTTRALQLKERSLYVAHELAQMIPLSGMDVYDEFRRLNDWTGNHLPNASTPPAQPIALKLIKKQPALQKFLESILSFPFADWFEKWEMKRKIKKLSQQQSSSFESYFSADVCKGHMDRHGENLGAALAIRLKKAL
jgi:hypothetical protein